jgi:hypothetical protein
MLNTDDALGAPLPLTIYYDVNPPAAVMPSLFNDATGLDLDLWLPSVVPSFNASANSAARAVSPFVITGSEAAHIAELEPTVTATSRFRNFLIPEADSEIVPGASVEFLFRYGSLWCARLADETDITSLTPWSFGISEMRLQRGGVTILNNVIDSLKSEKVIVKVEVPKAGNIVIQVFTLDGNLVKVLERGRMGGGTYTYFWDGTNGAGDPVERGMYFIRVVGPEMDEIRKVMVVKE